MKKFKNLLFLMSAALLAALPVNADAKEIVVADAEYGYACEYVANPVYPNIFGDEYTPEPDIYHKQVIVDGETVETDDYKDEAFHDSIVGTIRTAMENRQAEVIIKYTCADNWFAGGSLTANASNIVNSWVEEAYNESGVWTQGDYMRWNYGGHAVGVAGFEFEGKIYYTISYKFDYYTNSEEEKWVTDKINSIINGFGFTSGTSDYDKIDAIYDYICKNVAYDDEHLNDEAYTKKYTAYAALHDGTSVCQGYTQLAYRLMNACGIPCRIITGTSHNQNHAWNIVKLNGEYYNIDSTWDAGREKRSCFLQCDARFEDHVRNEEYSTADFYNQYPMASENYVNRMVDKEKIADFVTRVYDYVLSRKPDSGHDYWTQKLIDGEFDGTGVFVGYGFVFGDEFKRRNLDDREFVKVLYNTFMGREADEGGLNYWVGNLEGGNSREFAFSCFVGSDEYREICEECGIVRGNPNDYGDIKAANEAYRNRNINVSKYVARCYTKVLGRAYDPDGVEYWCKQIIEGTKQPIDVAREYVFSKEFLDKNTTDEQFVEVMYNMFFDRASDAGGKTYWLGVLDNNPRGRIEALDGFAYSPEFAEILKSFNL